MKNEGASNIAMPAGQVTENRVSKIDFGHIKLKLFSFYSNLVQILFILYN